MTIDPVDNGPFSLAKILEEEYAALHGPLPAETTLGEKDRLAALYTHIHDFHGSGRPFVSPAAGFEALRLDWVSSKDLPGCPS